MPPYLWGYFLVINLAAFAAMGVDKRRARLHRWRISEAALMALSLLGGSIGALLGMYCFRHKTRHALFYLGNPLIFAVEYGALIYFAWLR